jgi:serine/threonine protein kinase
MRETRVDRVAALFKAAIERDEQEWPAFLQASCAGDAELHAELESLLHHHREAMPFLEESIGQIAAETLPASATLAPGQLVGQYRIETLIGSGGMGEVYRATDTNLNREVAIKLIQRGMNTQAILRRFRQEEEILASLNHPNIAQLYGNGVTENGTPFFVMEYVAGTRVDQFCQQHALGVRERLELFRKICAAVAYAHQHLVIHRDLKPANIRVTVEGEPKLLDFGIAKLLDAATRSALEQTVTLQRVMTPEYASPEQVRGEGMTTASDVYSLGVILYELLTGQKPYRLKTETAEEISRAITQQTPAKPSLAAPTHRRALSGDLDKIVLMAMRKEPDRRYNSAAQLSDDLHRHLDGLPVIARGDSVTYRTSKFVQRNRIAVAAAVIVLASIITGLVLALVQAQVAKNQRDLAQRERAKAERINIFLQQLLSFSNQSVTSIAPVAQKRDVSVNEMLDLIVPQIEKELASDSEVRAQVLHTIGGAYASQGRYDSAGRIFRAALQIKREVYGEHSREAAETMLDLGVLNYRQGKLADAEQLLVTAWHTYEMPGPAYNPAKHALALDYYATVRFYRGDSEQALAHTAEALAIVTRNADKIDRRIGAFVKADRGSLLFYTGETEAAERLLRQALLEYGERTSSAQWEEGVALMGLAEISLAKNQADEAQHYLEESEQILRRTLGEDPYYFASLVLEQASLCILRKDLACAEAKARESLALRGDRQTASVPWALTMATLGGILNAGGHSAEAEDCLRKAIETYKTVTLPLPYILPAAEVELSQMLLKENRLDEAETVALEAYQIAHNSMAKLSGKKYATENLRKIYQAEGKQTEADQLK